MFKGGAEYVPIALEDTHLTMNGYKFKRVGELPIPDRFDVFPGTRLDANGSPIPYSFRGKVRQHLPEPPNGEQCVTPQSAKHSEFDSVGGEKNQSQSKPSHPW